MSWLQKQIFFLQIITYYRCIVYGQCDRYIKFQNGSIWQSLNKEFEIDTILEKCLPDYSFDIHLDTSYGGTNSSTIGIRSSVLTSYSGTGITKRCSGTDCITRFTNYFDCDFSVHINNTKSCIDSNCVLFDPPPDDFDDYYPTIFDSNVCNDIAFVKYGYYVQECSLMKDPLNDTIYYQWECECNDTYLFTVYSMNGECLLRLPFYINETYDFNLVEIDCNASQCMDTNDPLIVDYPINDILFDYSKCNKECIIGEVSWAPTMSPSTIPSVSPTGAAKDDTWFIIAIAFIVLFGVTVIIIGYLSWKVCKSNNKLKGGYQQTRRQQH